MSRKCRCKPLLLLLLVACIYSFTCVKPVRSMEFRVQSYYMEGLRIYLILPLKPVFAGDLLNISMTVINDRNESLLIEKLLVGFDWGLHLKLPIRKPLKPGSMLLIRFSTRIPLDARKGNHTGFFHLIYLKPRNGKFPPPTDFRAVYGDFWLLTDKRWMRVFISSLRVSGEIYRGKTLKGLFTVRCQGNTPARNLTLKVYLDDQLKGMYKLDKLHPGESIMFKLLIKIPKNEKTGLHKLKVKLLVNNSEVDKRTIPVVVREHPSEEVWQLINKSAYKVEQARNLLEAARFPGVNLTQPFKVLEDAENALKNATTMCRQGLYLRAKEEATKASNLSRKAVKLVYQAYLDRAGELVKTANQVVINLSGRIPVQFLTRLSDELKKLEAKLSRVKEFCEKENLTAVKQVLISMEEQVLEMPRLSEQAKLEYKSYCRRTFIISFIVLVTGILMFMSVLSWAWRKVL